MSLPFCTVNTADVLTYLDETIPELFIPEKVHDKQQLHRDAWEIRLAIGRAVGSFFTRENSPPEYSFPLESATHSNDDHGGCQNCSILYKEIDDLKQQVQWLTEKFAALGH
ncbi:hypothetical protein P9112_000320 [Eukaryota sp. TZLM1-RC]